MAREFFDLSFDIERLYWKLDEAKLKQIPFALANALTITAGQSKDALQLEIRDVFDKPTPWIQRSIRFSRTSKKGPFFVYVFLSEDNEKGIPPVKILRAHVRGGQRRQKRHERSMALGGLFGEEGDGYTRPASRTRGARLNQYGNLSGPKYQSILSRLKLLNTEGSDQNETTRSKVRNKNKNRAEYYVGEGDRWRGVWERYGPNQGKRGKTILPRKRRPVLIFIKKARYEDRFDIKFVVETTFNKNMSKNFGFALARAIKTAK